MSRAGASLRLFRTAKGGLNDRKHRNRARNHRPNHDGRRVGLPVTKLTKFEKLQDRVAEPELIVAERHKPPSKLGTAIRYLVENQDAIREMIEKRDRPKTKAAALSGLQQEIESFNDVGLKAFKRHQNTLPVKGLSYIEAYHEGILWIALEYHRRSGGTNVSEEIGNSGSRFIALVNGNSNVVESPVSNLCGNDNVLRSRDQYMVFIRDVEQMKTVKAHLPAFVRLYAVHDGVYNGIGQPSKTFMSIDGTYKRLPVLAEREQCISSNLSPVGFGDDAIGVIQRSAEIVNGVSEDCWGVLGERRRFPRTIISLGPETLDISFDERLEDFFEPTDVMFGPFYL